MFDQLVVSGARGIKTNKPWTVVLSGVVQIAILGIPTLIPLDIIRKHWIPDWQRCRWLRRRLASSAPAACNGREDRGRFKDSSDQQDGGAHGNSEDGQHRQATKRR